MKTTLLNHTNFGPLTGKLNSVSSLGVTARGKKLRRCTVDKFLFPPGITSPYKPIQGSSSSCFRHFPLG